MTPQFDEAVSAFQRGDLDRARALGEQLLATGADSAGLDHLLGLIDCRTGRLESGVARLRRALDKAPADVPVRVMLARALVDSGRAAEALDIAQPPGGITAPELALWHARAEAADACGAWAEAAQAWERLCAVRGDDWLAWSNLGRALGQVGRWPEAALALDRAVSLRPTDVPLRRNFAGALNNAGRFEESVAQFRRCIADAPSDKFLRISLAPILAELGRDEESRQELEEAARICGLGGLSDDGEELIRLVMAGSGQVDVIALKELADLLERGNRMEALVKLLEDANALGVSSEEIGYSAAAAPLRRGDADEAKRLLLTEDPAPIGSRWHWLMARIEDALGNSSAAFAEASAMNRLTQGYEHWRQLAAEHRNGVRRFTNAMSLDWFAGLQTLGEDSRGTPAFIVGFPRSGTTLLDTFLRGHPHTLVLEEVPLTLAAQQAIGELTELPQRSRPQIEAARNAYFRALDRDWPSPDVQLLIDKLPLNMTVAPLIHCLFPDAPIIFAQRHPCDVVLSCFIQGFVMNNSMGSFLDLGDAADFYDAAMSCWTKSREGLSLPVHTVVYEELVADPEAVLKPSIEFLGLDWRPELLDHRATAKRRGRIATPSYSQVAEPVSSKSAGRWRRYEKQLEPVLPVLLPWAKRLGYED